MGTLYLGNPGDPLKTIYKTNGTKPRGQYNKNRKTSTLCPKFLPLEKYRMASYKVLHSLRQLTQVMFHGSSTKKWTNERPYIKYRTVIERFTSSYKEKNFFLFCLNGGGSLSGDLM